MVVPGISPLGPAGRRGSAKWVAVGAGDVSSSRSAKERAEERERRRALGLPLRGDREAGRAKTPFPPKGGRNARGRGKGRNKQGRRQKATG
jgi:hypothetical protein